MTKELLEPHQDSQLQSLQAFKIHKYKAFNATLTVQWPQFFYFFISFSQRKKKGHQLLSFDLELSCCQKTLSPLHEAKTQKQKTRKSNLSDLLLLGIDVPLHTRNQPALHKSANENQIKNTLIIFYF